jgi:hypothetical protein
MLYDTSSLTISVVLGISMFLIVLAGRQLKKRRIKKDAAFADESFGAVEGALLGLLALLLSFTFGMSNTRYENRYQAMVHEANCIGTVILRSDLLADSAAIAYKMYCKGYLQSRIDLYDAGRDREKYAEAGRKSSVYGDSLWKLATATARSEDIVKRTDALPIVSALNDMFDAATSRGASIESTIPESILWLLFLLCCAAAFIIGYGGKQTLSWILVAGFAAMVSIAVFAILDLDRPFRGLIKLDKAEALISDLKGSIK